MESNIRSALNLESTPYPKLSSYCLALATSIIDEINNNFETLINQNVTGTITILTGDSAGTYNLINGKTTTKGNLEQTS